MSGSGGGGRGIAGNVWWNPFRVRGFLVGLTQASPAGAESGASQGRMIKSLQDFFGKDGTEGGLIWGLTFEI